MFLKNDFELNMEYGSEKIQHTQNFECEIICKYFFNYKLYIYIKKNCKII